MGRPKGSKNKKTLLKEQEQLLSDQLVVDSLENKEGELETTDSELSDRILNTPVQLDRISKVPTQRGE